MSQDKLFVIAVGGTGMRCLESFVHLCAIGLFDNQEINILTLDTDQTNGNLKRVWDLINLYNEIKTPTGSTKIEDAGGKPSSKTFFSAKLNLTKYWPSYSGDVTYQKLSKIAIKDESTQENLDLASLFFDEPAQTFNLAHGYRAQTHLGSQLMHHAIVEAALNVKHGKAKPQETHLLQYIESIVKAGKNSRIFILGSIFGGTGASSIPVIPIAFKEAYKLTKDLPIEGKFGASLLTEYFTFTAPQDPQKKKQGQGVIADANYFTLNSQAALQFYENDPTVESTYKYLYNIGWPVNTKADFSMGKNETETITGGEKQLNPCHVTELLCAFAAYDFFYRDDFPEKKVEYLFRTVKFEENTFNFDFKDFLSVDDKFKNGLAGFYSIALLTLIYHGGIEKEKEGITGWLDRMKAMKFTDYENALVELDKKQINEYFTKFLFSKDNSGNLIDGWLYQVRNSFSGKFLIPNSSFAKGWVGVNKINPGQILEDEKSQWGRKKEVGKVSNEFVDTFIDRKSSPVDFQMPTASGKERLIAQLFNTITAKQNIS